MALKPKKTIHIDIEETQVTKKLDKILKLLGDIQGKEVIIMAAIDDLKARVADLQQLAATVGTSVANEIARVEAVITALQAGSISEADVAKAASDLQGVVDNLKTVGTSLDAERP